MAGMDLQQTLFPVMFLFSVWFGPWFYRRLRRRFPSVQRPVIAVIALVVMVAILLSARLLLGRFVSDN
jgi:hypothetical protein